MRLYLASTSPARLATLRAAGIEPILLSSGVDEEAAGLVEGGEHGGVEAASQFIESRGFDTHEVGGAGVRRVQVRIGHGERHDDASRGVKVFCVTVIRRKNAG